RSVSAQRELAFEQAIDCIFVHKEQHKVGGLCTDLQTETTAAQLEISWRAPSIRGAATDDSSAAASTDDKPGLDDIRKDSYTFGAIKHTARDFLVGRVHHFVEDLRGFG